MTLTHTSLPKAYSLPKIHKKDCPLRPIISTINSPIHFLSKILYNSLKNCIQKPKSHLDNSFQLKLELKNIIVPPNHILISLDVQSLFTNVSCELVLKSLDRRYSQINNKCTIPFHMIRDITLFLFDNTYFVFNQIFYKQIFETPMGSPISPLFADIVMDDLETDGLEILKRTHNFSPYFYHINVIPTYTNTLNNIIRLGKDRTNKFDETGVVYKITCNDCKSIYIGQTKRCLLDRISEHKKTNNEDSVLSQHQKYYNHTINWENVSILDREKNYKKRLFSEMLFINSHNFTLKKIEDTQGLNRIYKCTKLLI